MTQSPSGARPPQLSARARGALAKRLKSISGQITTASTTEMEARHDWFRSLDADTRSWVGVVARAGIDGFVSWFAEGDHEAQGLEVFGAAPRALARNITLHQTVELVRTTIDTVESKLQELMPRNDRPVVQAAIMSYSREIAFAAAEVYARAAETRGAWDARLEALVVDAVVRGETDETVISRASTLGWGASHAVAVVVGAAPASEPANLGEELRRRANKNDIDLLSAIQGDRLVVVMGGPPLTTGSSPLSNSHKTKVSIDTPPTVRAAKAVEALIDVFGPGPVVIGPIVDHLMDASGSARAALSGYRAAPAWPEATRPVHADDLLPERALAGDTSARQALARDVYGHLDDVGSGLLETLICFFDQGSSIEAASRALFVHPNTVRYRLKRVHEVTGFNPSDARDAYVLRLAITLGRLLLAPGTDSAMSRPAL